MHLNHPTRYLIVKDPGRFRLFVFSFAARPSGLFSNSGQVFFFFSRTFFLRGVNCFFAPRKVDPSRSTRPGCQQLSETFFRTLSPSSRTEGGVYMSRAEKVKPFFGPRQKN